MTPKEFAKKIIASINPGTADISGIGDGTIKGAISELNSNLNWKEITNEWTSYQKGSVFPIPDNTSELYLIWKNTYTACISSGVFPYPAVKNINTGIFLSSRSDSSKYQISIKFTTNGDLYINNIPSEGTENVMRLYYR